jgi:signal transduction histidine kinase/ligand-binding sensor domain-containing protein
MDHLSPGPGLSSLGVGGCSRRFSPPTSLFCLLVLPLLLFPFPTHAVDTLSVTQSDPILDDWRWTTFDKSDGLAGALHEVYEDEDNNIWFGTTAGVQKYDGFRWTTYTVDDGLVHNGVNDIIRTRDGAMWFGTGGGISRLSVSETGEQDWAAYTFDDSSRTTSLCQARDGSIWAGFATGNQSGVIRRFAGGKWSTVEPGDGPTRPRVRGGIIQGTDGAVWFGTETGILRFEGMEWTWTGTGRIEQIMESSDGSIWVARFSEPSGVAQFDGHSWQHFSPDKVGVRRPRAVWQDDDGTIWVGGDSELSRFRDGEWFSYPRFRVNRQLDPMIHGRSASQGVTWFWSTYGRKAIRFRAHRDVAYFSQPDSLQVGLEGPDGAMWFYSATSVVRLQDNVWLRYTAKDGFLDGNVHSLARSQDSSIWAAGSHRGLGAAARFHNGRWEVFTEKDDVIDAPNRAFATRDGHLWVMGTHGGISAVSRFDGATWRRFDSQSGFSGTYGVLSGYEASDGTVWFMEWVNDGSGTGILHRFDPSVSAGQQWLHFTKSDSFLGAQVGSLCEWPVGTLWTGTLQGVQRIELSGLPRDQTWWSKTDFDIGSPKFDSCVPTDAGIWFTPKTARKAGAVHFDGESWHVLKEDDGLPGNVVRGISRASDGTVWFFGQAGLSRFDSSKGRDGWTRFDTADGIRPFSVWRSDAVEARDGSLWMNVDGKQVFRFRYHEPSVPLTRMKTTVERVTSAGNILIRWAGNTKWNTVQAQDLRYKWRLNEGEWKETAETDITFTSLAPGGYRFEVYTIAPSTRLDASPAIHAFIVEGPWWRNPVVAGPGLLLIIGILFQSARVVQRDRRLREANLAMSDANKELFQVNVDLQREQVLERLRGQAQGMQSSEDIGPMVEAVYREMTQLGLPLFGSSINIRLSDTERAFWALGADGRAREPQFRPRDPGGAGMKARSRGQYYLHQRSGSEKVRNVIRKSIEEGSQRWVDIPEAEWPKEHHEFRIFHERGGVTLTSWEPIEEEYLQLIKRFGEVFEYAHSRHKELRDKEAQNRRLAVDASVQRLRAEVQSMEQASDFERILSLLTDGLKTVELDFEGCEIDVLDEPTENPTMDHFASEGFRYTTFKMDAGGNVAPSSYALSAPFPSVIERTIERFIAGEPYQGTSEGEAILEVPAGSYGRLRVTSTEREGFAEEEVETLREFAEAVALGYARYLDIRAIQQATQRKSAFLASMSHELRTPMNAIKGFTNLVLRRGKDELSERNQENLEKVSHASDHLLTMINDLLDLSKIEAGRMDVNVEAFDVKEMIASACDTVSPLVQEGVALGHDVAEGVGEANTDRARVQQMVINLLTNAIKFTESGSVTVKAALDLPTPQSPLPTPASLTISVSDTGKGIPPDEIPTLFDEYRQVEGESESSVQKGTGLGLSITKKFAELLGGSIGVESEVGSGSTFKVTIPIEYES